MHGMIVHSQLLMQYQPWSHFPAHWILGSFFGFSYLSQPKPWILGPSKPWTLFFRRLKPWTDSPGSPRRWCKLLPTFHPPPPSKSKHPFWVLTTPSPVLERCLEHSACVQVLWGLKNCRERGVNHPFSTTPFSNHPLFSCPKGSSPPSPPSFERAPPPAPSEGVPFHLHPYQHGANLADRQT